MQAHSDEFDEALSGSIQPVFQVNAWREGQIVSGGANLPLVGGSVTVTGGQAIRSRVTLSVADPDGVLVPSYNGAVSPYGTELQINAGLKMGATSEMFSLGWFPIVDSSSDESWRVIARPSEPGSRYTVSRGSHTSVEATDRAQLVSENRFLTREQPRESGVLNEIGRLLRGIIPWAGSTIADRSIPTTVTYDDDRLGAIKSLASVLDAEFIINSSGYGALIRVPSTTSAVWTIGTDQLQTGSLIKFQRKISRSGVYNAVVCRGADSGNGTPVQGIATEPEGPFRWDGPMGRIPYFMSSPILNTNEKCQRAALTQLNTLKNRRTQTIPIQCVPNYALEVGDIVLLQTPTGKISGEVRTITWPLTAGPLMTLTIAVSMDEFTQGMI